MTSKKTPTIKQLLTPQDDASQARPTPLRTIWNTSCGGYPASELIAVSGAGKTGGEPAKKTAKGRAKAL